VISVTLSLRVSRRHVTDLFLPSCSCDDEQAGRFYAERSAAKKRAQYLSTQPESSTDSSSSGPLERAATAVEDATTPVPEYSSGSVGSSAGGKKTRRRAQTPYREMTEEELLELNQSEKPAR
jgi:hypothetical protein